MKAIASLWHFPLAGSLPFILFVFYGVFKKSPPASNIIKSYLFIILLFSLYLICLSIVSSSQDYGIYKSFFFLAFDFILLFFLAKIVRFEEDVLSLVKGLILGGLFFLLLSAWFFLYHGIEITRYSRASLGEGNPIVWAQQLGQGVILFAWMAIKSKKFTLYVIFGVCVILSILLMILSGSKGPIVAIFLTLIILAMFRCNIKYMAVSVIIVLGMVAIIGTWEPFISEGSHLNAFISQRYDISDSGSVESRMRHLNTVRDFIRENGILVNVFGSGTGNYAFVYSGTSTRLFPHNIFFEIFLENGIIGTSLFMAVISLPFLYIIAQKKRKQTSSVMYCIFSLYVFSICCAQFSGDLIANWIIIFYGLLVFSCKKNISTKSDHFCALNNRYSVKILLDM
jgi:O-antigen ligase